jgi:hypothetical protein
MREPILDVEPQAKTSWSSAPPDKRIVAAQDAARSLTALEAVARGVSRNLEALSRLRPRRDARESAWRRPDGWVGRWSKRYGQVLARTFGARPPLDASMQELVAYAPYPFSEALEPLASAAEPVDREGHALAWRWERSVTRDLLGVSGVALGIAGLLLIAALMLLRFAGPPPKSTTTDPGQQQPQPQQQQQP